MSTLKLWTRLVICIASFTSLSRAVTVFAAGTNTVEACGFAVNPAARILGHLPYPSDWRVVVVCNENAWDQLMRQDRVNFVSNYAFTFQPNHVTFIRAKVFLEPMHYTPEQILRHELGHVVCRCDDEEAAWRWAAKKLTTGGQSPGMP